MVQHLRTPHDVILQSWFTERTTALQQNEGRYTFKIDLRANKYMVREAIEKIFKVKVDSVRILTVRGKMRRVRFQAGSTPHWKKAIVKLKPGFSIEF